VRTAASKEQERNRKRWKRSGQRKKTSADHDPEGA